MTTFRSLAPVLLIALVVGAAMMVVRPAMHVARPGASAQTALTVPSVPAGRLAGVPAQLHTIEAAVRALPAGLAELHEIVAQAAELRGVPWPPDASALTGPIGPVGAASPHSSDGNGHVPVPPTGTGTRVRHGTRRAASDRRRTSAGAA